MSKKMIVAIVAALCVVAAQAINVTSSSGWLETAFVTWEPVPGATNYVVTYSGEGISDKQIDAELIRSYGSYIRADIVGLKAGNYTVGIKALDGNSAVLDNIVVPNIAVLAHDRNGFAHSPNSTRKTASGAYNDDGTLRTGAVVLYITSQTANTVKLTVKTASNKTEERTGIANILTAREKGFETTPMAVRIIGKLNASNVDGLDSDNALVTKGKTDFSEQNITIEGIGNDATFYGMGLKITKCSNFEVRNLGFMKFPEDGIEVTSTGRNCNVWIHNCDFFYGVNGGGDKDKGDGSLDCKEADFCTFSYNHFWDSGKCNLLGNGTEIPGNLTYHHNWYDHSDSRHPRVRCHTVHVYNNYFDGNSKYGTGSTMASSVFVEANFYRSCKRPMLISMQGSDIAGGGGGTFSSEAGGIIKACNNHIEGSYTFTPYSATNTIEFDAWVAANRNDQVPGTVTAKKGGSSYNNFDTNATMYAYTPDSPEDAKAKVMQYAGRVQGGDFKWTFSASEDTNYEIIAALANAINNYNPTGGVIVGGDGGEEPNPDLTAPVLNEATSITEHGFTLEWSAVENATQYEVTVNWEDASASTDIFRETFDKFTSDITGNALTSGLTDNPASAFTQINGGSNMLCTEAGAMDLNNGRFVLENLNYSSSPHLYIKIKFASGDAAKRFQVGKTAGTSSVNDIYDSKNSAAKITTEYTTLDLTIPADATLVQLRAENGGTYRIDDIRIAPAGSAPAIKSKPYTVDAPATSLVIDDLETNVRYAVMVVAKNGTEKSAASNTIYATPKVTNGIKNIEKQQNIAYSFNGKIILREKGNYFVYNTEGKAVGRGYSSTEDYMLPEQFRQGLYLVKTNSIMAKVIVK